MTVITNAAVQTAHWALKGISDDTEEQFTAKISAALTAIAAREGYIERLPRWQPTLNLFGYGTVREVLTTPDGEGGYFWGHDAAEALGWDAAEFAKWANEEWKHDLIQQRDVDEETGVLGWDCIRCHPMHVSVWQGDGRSQDHYVGGMMSGPSMRYWRDLYLIHTDRIMSMMMASPWGKEWFAAVKPMMAWGFEKSGLAAALGGITSHTVRENALGESEIVDTGATLAEVIAKEREGVTEQDAIDRAMRGPGITGSDEGTLR